MSLQLSDPASFHRSGGTQPLKGHISGLAFNTASPIPSSRDVSGVELRMLAPLIIENKTTPVWPFPGYSQLYCMTIVVSDVTNQLAGAIDLKGFPRIGDQEYLPINKTIFYWQNSVKGEKAPSQIHVLSSVIKSKKDLRDVGTIMTEIKDDSNYQSVISTLGQIAKNAAKINVVSDLVMQIGGLVGKYLGKVEDKPIGTVLNSYTTLHGDFDTVGVQKLSYPTKNVQFNFDLVIRNKTVETKLIKNLAGKNLSLAGKPKLNLAEIEHVVVDMEPL